MKLLDRHESTNELLAWPLVLIILDGYEPQLARLVIEVATERDTETCGLVWGIMADAARDELNLN